MAQTHALANMRINCIIIGNMEVSFADIILSYNHKKSPLFQERQKLPGQTSHFDQARLPWAVSDAALIKLRQYRQQKFG